MMQLKVIAFLWDLETFQVVVWWVYIDNIFIRSLDNKKKDSATYQPCILMQIRRYKEVLCLKDRLFGTDRLSELKMNLCL